ncbi:hypothetical protein J6590_094648 [Homalodisca vitripennis]|nr:hypothetical protein J6590_039598 [Homalodisca vitripennis]KAG8299690.1 hypothetical protein J6590_094648 [Homalodisca vitripennis]
MSRSILVFYLAKRSDIGENQANISVSYLLLGYYTYILEIEKVKFDICERSHDLNLNLGTISRDAFLFRQKCRGISVATFPTSDHVTDRLM